jgi:hypothetical protein
MRHVYQNIWLSFILENFTMSLNSFSPLSGINTRPLTNINPVSSLSSSEGGVPLLTPYENIPVQCQCHNPLESVVSSLINLVKDLVGFLGNSASNKTTPDNSSSSSLLGGVQDIIGKGIEWAKSFFGFSALDGDAKQGAQTSPVQGGLGGLLGGVVSSFSPSNLIGSLVSKLF